MDPVSWRRGPGSHPGPRAGPTQSNETWTRKSVTRRGLTGAEQVGSEVQKERTLGARGNLSPAWLCVDSAWALGPGVPGPMPWTGGIEPSSQQVPWDTVNSSPPLSSFS